MLAIKSVWASGESKGLDSNQSLGIDLLCTWVHHFKFCLSICRAGIIKPVSPGRWEAVFITVCMVLGDPQIQWHVVQECNKVKPRRLEGAVDGGYNPLHHLLWHCL